MLADPRAGLDEIEGPPCGYRDPRTRRWPTLSLRDGRGARVALGWHKPAEALLDLIVRASDYDDRAGSA